MPSLETIPDLAFGFIISLFVTALITYFAISYVQWSDKREERRKANTATPPPRNYGDYEHFYLWRKKQTRYLDFGETRKVHTVNAQIVATQHQMRVVNEPIQRKWQPVFFDPEGKAVSFEKLLKGWHYDCDNPYEAELLERDARKGMLAFCQTIREWEKEDRREREPDKERERRISEALR